MEMSMWRCTQKEKKLMAYVQIESLNLGTPKLGTQTNMQNLNNNKQQL
jgi:hypothetical protein